MNPLKALYLRNFVFGVEDSLVSTVGLVSGVAAAGSDKGTVLLTGIILIFVEAFSMGVGSFLSERSVEEYARRGEVSPRPSFAGGVVMFVSYFVAGFIPLGPYLAFPLKTAFIISIAASLVALFLLGIVSGRAAGRSPARTGLRMLLMGGCAIALGVAVGKLIK